MMKTIILFLLVLATVPLQAAEQTASGIRPFDPKDTNDKAVRQLWCDLDKNGRIIRVDAYGISIRELIQAMAILAHEEVEIKECPSDMASLSYRDLGFAEIVHRIISSDGYEIIKGDQGRYIVRKKKQ